MGAEITQAVVMARGLGTRMRRPAPGAEVGADQARVADTGVKAMIPVGRPFLDFVLSALADAGLCDICLVIGPEHGVIRDYYTRQQRLSRVRIRFAIQQRPLGTADAVAAAADCTGDGEFLVLNSDNYYPAHVLEALRRLAGPGLAGFERQALVAQSNIAEDRVNGYALLRVGTDGFLEGLVEKPGPDAWGRSGPDALISMNCWRFGPSIFDAARRIGLSPRGEYELGDAVADAMAHGERFRVVPVRAGVLDLSMRADIPSVTHRLQGVEVRL